MNMQGREVVPYFRVSTRKQGDSGLGLDAQRTSVDRFRLHEQCNPIAEFVEIESGKKSNRPELRKAIELCKARGAVLVVAKLDRLARNVAFTSALMDSGVEFIACDMPQANRLTIHILAAVSEDEARRISQRTKAALAELKAKGVPLGSARPGHWEGIHQKYGQNMRGWGGMTAEKRAIAKREHLEASFGGVLPLILSLRSRGVTMQEIARELNRYGHKTPRGASFASATIQNILTRCEVCGALSGLKRKYPPQAEKLSPASLTS